MKYINTTMFLCVQFCLVIRICVVGANNFVFPKSFVGLWNGEIESNAIGPNVPYSFSISQSPNGDYLLENNLVYDLVPLGWQRFYVEGTGSTAGSLWYCGSVSHYSDYLEQTGTSRLNLYIPLEFPSSDDQTVTFCLDSSDPDVMGSSNPFMDGCKGCGCSSWTMTYDPSTDSLSSLLVMSGTELGSNHLVTTLKRAGAAPVVSDADMPGHGANFSCEFWEGGRDSVPVNQSTALSSLRVLSTDDNAHQQVKSSACPYLSRKLVSESPSTTSDKTQRTMDTSSHNKPASKHHMTSSLDYAHCYSLNNAAGYHLQWTLDKDNALLHVAVSAPSVSGPGTYVAIGFRPLSRSSANELVRRGTGSHMNFGMQGADIVTGSVSLGVKQYYAELYTGAPVSSTALDLTNASVVFDASTNRTVLYFTRPLVSGHLAKAFNMSASILSPFADVLWAVGAEGAAMCDYHYNTRGMRAIDWEEPEIAMPEEWKC